MKYVVTDIVDARSPIYFRFDREGTFEIGEATAFENKEDAEILANLLNKYCGPNYRYIALPLS